MERITSRKNPLLTQIRKLAAGSGRDRRAAGEYLAVLYSDSMVLYTRDLQEHARLEGTDYAGRVIMEEDGTALVLTGTAAWRFLP